MVLAPMALALAETGPGGTGWNAGVAAAPLSSWRDQPFAAIRRASSRVSSLAAERRPVSSSQYVANGISLTFLPDHSGPQPIISVVCTLSLVRLVDEFQPSL